MKIPHFNPFNFNLFSFVGLKIIIIVVLFANIAEMNAQNMYVKQKDGSQNVYKLSDIAVISFAMNSFTVTLKDNYSQVHPLSDVRYLSFKEYTSVEELPASKQEKTLKLYPNPVENTLQIEYISALGGSALLEIYNTAGKLLMKKEFTAEMSVNHLSIELSSFPLGIYICHLSENGSSISVKFIKK